MRQVLTVTVVVGLATIIRDESHGVVRLDEAGVAVDEFCAGNENGDGGTSTEDRLTYPSRCSREWGWSQGTHIAKP